MIVSVISKTVHPNGKVNIVFAGGDGMEFPTVADYVEWCTAPDKDVMLCRQIACGIGEARGNFNTVLNKDVTFDLSNPNSIRVQ